MSGGPSIFLDEILVHIHLGMRCECVRAAILTSEYTPRGPRSPTLFHTQWM